MNKYTVFYNAKVITMDPELPLAEAVVIDKDKICHVGSKEDVFDRFPDSIKIDLAGKSLVPGFIDSHCHLTLTGELMTQLNVFDLKSVSECLESFRDEASRHSKGEAIFASGIDIDRLKEGRLPTIEELDRVVPDSPFFCRNTSGHGTIVNSIALSLVIEEARRLGVAFKPDDIANGFLRNQINLLTFPLAATLMSESQRAAAINKVAAQCARAGVTTAHTLEGRLKEKDPDVAYLLQVKDKLPLDTLIYYQTTHVDAVINEGLSRIGGCVSCVLDGDFAPGTAALREPYYNDSANYGNLYFSDKQLADFFTEANRRGLQIAIHAVGDAACEQALKAYEAALKDTPRKDHRHRIEHFEIPDDGLMDRAYNLGITLGMQPAFDYYWGYEEYARYLGPERALRKNPFRAILNKGLVVGGGSDCFVTPISPILGIHACLNHSVAASRIGLNEALSMFTMGCAYIGFEEKTKGSIKVGKQADLAILSEDIYETPKERIKDVKVMGTVYKGKFVWKDPDSPW